MATNFPTSLDSFTNPGTTSALNSPSHAGQHTDINDAMVQVQTKLGTTPSAGAHVIGKLVTTWTPVIQNLTVGNGTMFGVYAIVNDLAFYQVRFIFGSTSAITGALYIEYPLQVAETWLGAVGGVCAYDDANGSDYFGVIYRSSGVRGLLSTLRSDSTHAKADGVDAITPFTWASGDKITIEDWIIPA